MGNYRKISRAISDRLDRINAKFNEVTGLDELPDEDELTITSIDVRDTLDSEGNVSSSVIEKHEEQDIRNIDIEELKELVAIRKEYGDSWKDIAKSLISAGASVGLVLLLIWFENDHVITRPKAFSFIPKPR